MIAIIKSDSKNLFSFHFYGKEYELTFCELLTLRNKVAAININNHFYSDCNLFGIEIISICNLKHILILQTSDILKLKDISSAIFSPEEIKVNF